MEVLAFISFFLGASWDFFTGVKVPGFDFTFAALFVGIFLASLGLRFLSMMLGLTIHSSDVKTVGTAVNEARKPWWAKKSD